MQHAPGLLVGMRHNDLLLHDVIGDNSAISACEQGGQLQHALVMLVGMRNNNVLHKSKSLAKKTLKKPMSAKSQNH